MFEKDIEERLEALERKFDDLSAELDANKKKREEEETLIPGAEYDFVPFYEPQVIGRYMIRVGKIVEADSLLGLTDEEWKQFSTEDDG